MILRSALIALLLVPLSTRVWAQWSPDLRTGSRVRLRLPEREFQFMGPRGQSIRGTVAQLAPDTLYLRLGDSVGTVAIPRTLVRRLDLSRGVPSRISSAARTGVVWGVVYAIVAALYVDHSSSSLSDTERATIGGGVGLTLGAVFGAIYPVERWKHLHLEPSLAHSSANALNVSLAVSR